MDRVRGLRFGPMRSGRSEASPSIEPDPLPSLHPRSCKCRTVVLTFLVGVLSRKDYFYFAATYTTLCTFPVSPNSTPFIRKDRNVHTSPWTMGLLHPAVDQVGWQFILLMSSIQLCLEIYYRVGVHPQEPSSNRCYTTAALQLPFFSSRSIIRCVLACFALQPPAPSCFGLLTTSSGSFVHCLGEAPGQK